MNINEQNVIRMIIPMLMLAMMLMVVMVLMMVGGQIEAR